MINFLQNAFVFFVFATPIMAAIVLSVGIFDKQLRFSLLPSLVGMGIGFITGVSLGGGFGQTEGWGWGNVGAAILGICYAATGFLIGFGIYCIGLKSKIGWLIVVAGLTFPLVHFGRMELYPILSRAEMDWWSPILSNGSSGISVDEATQHLSEPTKQSLSEYIYRGHQIEPSTLRLLFHAGIMVTNYVPLPDDVAQEIYAQNPGNIYLALNPSTSEDILIKFSNSNDQNVLQALSKNKKLPAAIKKQLQLRFQSEIDTQSAKSNPDWYTINIAKDALKTLAKEQSGN